MNLPTTFTRPEAAPLDVLPVDGPGGQDFVGGYAFQNPTGAPLTSILVAYNGPQATLAATLWIWEGTTKQWLQVGGALTLTKGLLTKVAVPSPFGTSSKGAGGVDAALIVAAGVTAGTYTLAMGPSAS